VQKGEELYQDLPSCGCEDEGDHSIVGHHGRYTWFKSLSKTVEKDWAGWKVSRPSGANPTRTQKFI